jgi:hypothetical protein
MAKSTPRPVQFTPFTPEHFTTKEGISFVNLQFSQIVDALNRVTGQAGTVVLPAGLDVQGGKVSGLAAPTEESDAVSLGHSNANYGAPAVGKQLDLGGGNTLTGLSNLYLLMGQSFTGTITIPKLTGGGSNGSITVSGGLVTKVVQPT